MENTSYTRSYSLPNGLSATIAAVVMCISLLVILRREIIGISLVEAIVYLGTVFALPIFTALWLRSYRIKTDGKTISVTSLLGSYEIDFSNRDNFQLFNTPIDIGRPTAKGITKEGKQITIWIQLMGLEDCVDLLQFLGFDFKISNSENE